MTLPPCSPAFEWKLRNAGWTLVCRALAPCHGWTARATAPSGGSISSPDWPRIAREAGVSADRVVSVKQVHGAEVIRVVGGSPGSDWPGDALVSDDPAVLLTVRIADCVPILIGDRVTGAVAAVHAGWRGTSAGIAGRTIATMTDAFGARPADLVAALGPSIGPCCYETGAAVPDGLRRAGWPSDVVMTWFTGPEGRHFDLWRANRDQLVAAGLSAEAVLVSELCTACHLEWFHSYRREGERTGRLGAYVRAAAAPW